MEQWYTFYTKPNSEKLVSQRLLDLGLQTFLPQLSIYEKRGKKQQLHLKRTEPFFPCYLFASVDLTLNSSSSLRWLPGVRGIVGTFNSPLAVPAAVIEGIRKKTDELNARSGSGDVPFKPGDQVRIVSGPFENLLATFDRPLPSINRVQILMEILGQVRRVQLDTRNLTLEKKSENPYNNNDKKRSRRSRGKGRLTKSS